MVMEMFICLHAGTKMIQNGTFLKLIYSYTRKQNKMHVGLIGKKGNLLNKL